MKKFICLTLCTFLWAGHVHAQGVTTGSLSGVVVDPNGDALPGVAIVAEMLATGNRFGTVTDAEGYFRMVNLKVGGPYDVQASLSGFQTQSLSNVFVRLGETTDLRIGMQLEAATGEIEVVGESSPLIAPTKMGVSSSVSQGSLEALPTIDRSVYDNVALPLMIQGFRGAEVGKRTRAALDKVGLLHKEKSMPITLSGGEQQRVGIARAVVHKPMLLLADEPTANLDSKTGKGLLEMMKEMNERKNVTFIFSTHDQMVMDYARRLVKLRDGMVVDDQVKGSQ